MPVAKSYSFVRFLSTEDAQKFFNSYNGSENVKSDGSPLYLSFTDSGNTINIYNYKYKIKKSIWNIYSSF